MAYNKDVFLEKVIQEYLKQREPIGSETLKSTLEIKVSSATIRNYFKVLMNEGVLVQPYISGGRIPTHFAMKNYWRSKLNFKNLVLEVKTAKEIKDACEKFQVFTLIRKKLNQKFKQLINHQDLFLILLFEDGEIVIPYQQNFERFLSELIGLDIDEIKNIAYQVMANELFEKIDALQSQKVLHFGLEHLDFLIQNPTYQRLFFEILEGKTFDKLSNGVYFEPIMPEGFIGIIQDIIHQDEDAKMLCIGSLMCDYQSFYKQIAA
ncbi:MULTISPECIES: HrcA family transcriptional regulator [unclassified Helicobacter]|uniref:HrcA family transcriptional regulator n=1 Tax=unclassified Helicobacter TaxID=2593540 RepID=UPI000CF035CE|nr:MULTISPECIES: HrcA family transcriptional regulator [unclassified Helicobacter]